MKSISTYLTNDERNGIYSIMKTFENNESIPQIGIFWYNEKDDDLFLVKTIDYNSVKDGVYNHLHKDIWKKEYFRALAKNKELGILKNDYKDVPRGRIGYNINTKTFIAYVGEWINDCEESVTNLIKDYFNLNTFEYKKDSHWNIGNGIENISESYI